RPTVSTSSGTSAIATTAKATSASSSATSKASAASTASVTLCGPGSAARSNPLVTDAPLIVIDSGAGPSSSMSENSVNDDTSSIASASPSRAGSQRPRRRILGGGAGSAAGVKVVFMRLLVAQIATAHRGSRRDALDALVRHGDRDGGAAAVVL